MLDLAITGGTLVDGTGAPRRRADVGMRDGKVVAVGDLEEAARRTIDASDLVVAPGFCDIHTHFDAQLWWDGGLTPSSIHGTTTVVSGNTGFTLAPMAPEHIDYITRMLSLVEGMPLESLQTAVPYTWSTFGEFLDACEGRLAVNAGFMVGHSTLRRYVMGADAVGSLATPAQIDAMVALLHESLDAGGLGFSTSTGELHFDGDGNPVPSRSASVEEMVALAAAAGAHPGTSLEIVPGKTARFTGLRDGEIDRMTRMSATANRAINWNLLVADGLHPELAFAMLENSKAATAAGARIVPLTPPCVLRAHLTFHSGFLLGRIPGWQDFLDLSAHEKVRALGDPHVRARLLETGDQFSWSWADMTVMRTVADENRSFVGRRVGDIATERGVRPLEAVFDILVADRLGTILLTAQQPGTGDEDEAWKLRAELWAEPEVIIGASDAGAHVDSLTAFTFGTSVLAACRERGMLDLEHAVASLTDKPARLYGLRDRGVVAPGAIADLVLFDPQTVRPGPVHWRDDLPAGAGRLYADAVGIDRVIVAGREVVIDNQLTGELPGTVLRAGRDTETVTAR